MQYPTVVHLNFDILNATRNSVLKSKRFWNKVDSLFTRF